MYEHQREIHELRKEMREKDSLLDDLTQNSEVQMQVGLCVESVVTCAFYTYTLCLEMRLSFS